MKVGIFEAIQIGYGQRWRVTNKLTGIAHVTYGTEKEVVEQLKATTAAWQRRTEKKSQKGSAWRTRRTEAPSADSRRS